MSEQIETAEALDALPVGSVVRGDDGHAWEREHKAFTSVPTWHTIRSHGDYPADAGGLLPATVLHRPDAPAPQPVTLRCCRNGCESEPTSIARDYWADDLSYNLVPVCATHAQPRTVSAEKYEAAVQALWLDYCGDPDRPLDPGYRHTLEEVAGTVLAALGLTVAEAGEVR
jgi:hypothetical protein